MTPDSELLRRYAGTKSEEAFAELVQRHVNLVYSAALRQVNGDAYLAQDVAQTVFTDLARKAGSLARREVLTGWLYTSAHFAAAKAVRTEQRRHAREQEAHTMRETIHTPAPEPDWNKLRPVLDEAMHQLKEADREAILLRYFENRQFAEVGAKLGLNENAARMRVERALEKLRAVFLRRGVAATATLASIISANAVQIAPAGLAATLTSASLAGAGTGTLTLLKLMTMTKLKLGLSALVVAGAATALVVQHQAQEKLRAESEALTQQIAQLKTDNENFSNRLAAAADSKSLPNDQFNELLKLRGEVGSLRRQLESQKAQVGQQPTSSREVKTTGHTPGTYISKDELAFVGYATPEAAFETIAWAMMKGTYEQVNKGLSPELLAEELKDSNGSKNFEANRDQIAPLFKGMQIVSKKVVSEDKVELKLKEDYDAAASQFNSHMPDFMVQPMVKIGNEWKLGGSTREYQNNWQNDGQIQTFVP